MTRSYRFGPVVVASSLPLPELPPARSGSGAAVQVEAVRSLPDAGTTWYHTWRDPDGNDWLRIGRVREGYRLSFPALAEFRLSADGAAVTGCARGASPDTFRHLLLDQVLPLVLVQRGWCVLHGGAVAGTGGAAAFIGPAGHGKSTLTASLASAGLRALTDDTLILTSGSPGHVAVHPAYPSIRVWPETAAAVLGARTASRRVSDLNDKVRVSAGRLEFGREAVRLRVLYLLAPDDTPGPPRAEPIAPRDRVMELVRHAFVLDWDRAERLSALFDTLVRLASDVPVRRLRFSHDYAALPALHRVVLDEVRAA